MAADYINALYFCDLCRIGFNNLDTCIQHVHRGYKTHVQLRGCFIDFEGLPGSGKAVQMSMLHERLARMGVKCEVYTFPNTNTAKGEMCCKYAKKELNLDVEAAHRLFYEHRLEFDGEIRRKLSMGITVIVKNYWYNGMAYTCAKDKNLKDWVCELEKNIMKPDMCFLMKPRLDASDDVNIDVERLIVYNMLEEFINPKSFESFIDTMILHDPCVRYRCLVTSRCQHDPEYHLFCSTGVQNVQIDYRHLTIGSCDSVVWNYREKYVVSSNSSNLDIHNRLVAPLFLYFYDNAIWTDMIYINDLLSALGIVIGLDKSNKILPEHSVAINRSASGDGVENSSVADYINAKYFCDLCRRGFESEESVRNDHMHKLYQKHFRQRGCFIVFEGVPGSGKSVQMNMLSERLSNMNIKNEVYPFPLKSTATGKLCHKFIQKKLKLGVESAHKLFYAHRLEFDKEIRHKLSMGITIIAKNYSHSGVAYTCSKKRKFEKRALELEENMMRPDICFLLKQEQLVHANVNMFDLYVMMKKLTKPRSFETLADNMIAEIEFRRPNPGHRYRCLINNYKTDIDGRLITNSSGDRKFVTNLKDLTRYSVGGYDTVMWNYREAYDVSTSESDIDTHNKIVGPLFLYFYDNAIWTNLIYKSDLLSALELVIGSEKTSALIIDRSNEVGMNPVDFRYNMNIAISERLVVDQCWKRKYDEMD